MKLTGKWSILLALALAVTCCVVVKYAGFVGDRGAPKVKHVVTKGQQDDGVDRGKHRRNSRVANRRRQAAIARKVDRDLDTKPVINVEDPEFAELDEMQREIIKEIQEMLDSEDFKALSIVISHMIDMGKQRALVAGSKDWSRYVPLVMKRKAVEALGWFGSEALPEIMGFIGDSDEEIAEDAQMRLEQALQDFELSDRSLAEIVVKLMSITSDPDTVDNYYMELARMRNSVMISTLVEIGQSGSDVAKEKLAENISFYTGDFSIETIEQAEEWLKENPDDEFDDEFYGGK